MISESNKHEYRHLNCRTRVTKLSNRSSMCPQITHKGRRLHNKVNLQSRLDTTVNQCLSHLMREVMIRRDLEAYRIKRKLKITIRNAKSKAKIWTNPARQTTITTMKMLWKIKLKTRQSLKFIVMILSISNLRLKSSRIVSLSRERNINEQSCLNLLSEDVYYLGLFLYAL